MDLHTVIFVHVEVILAVILRVQTYAYNMHIDHTLLLQSVKQCALLCNKMKKNLRLFTVGQPCLYSDWLNRYKTSDLLNEYEITDQRNDNIWVETLNNSLGLNIVLLNHAYKIVLKI